MENRQMEHFLSFLSEGKTQFHVVDRVKQKLAAAGYKKLAVNQKWELARGENYFVSPYASCLFAFSVGEEPRDIRIAASHTDFPMLKLKSHPEMAKKGYMTANVEPYGGLILSTWFDRPLGLAGKLVLKGTDAFHPRTVLYDSKRPLFLIPNLAPHLKRDSKAELDVAKEVVPLYAMDRTGEEGQWKDISEFLKQDGIRQGLLAPEDEILNGDLYLYCMEQPVLVGMNQEFLVSPRIDNISSVSALTEVLTQGTETEYRKEAGESEPLNRNSISVAAYFDNEEIGSRSKQGADSGMLQQLLERVLDSLNLSETERAGLLGNIFMVSLDVAHGLHPNYPEKNDSTNEVLLGKGIVLKSSASQRYVSDSEAGAVIMSICKKHEVPLQLQANRSGMPGGQTLGPIISSYIPAMAADMGIPLLAMHSACETAHKADYLELVRFAGAFFAE
jgi:aspartyl aminopeptidase